MAQCLDLRPCVDFGVAVRRGEIRVPKPATDDVHVDACLEEVDGRRVAEDMRAGPTARALIIEVPGVAADDLVEAEASQRVTSRGSEHRCLGPVRRVRRVEELGQERCGLAPQGARAPLVALSMEPDQGSLAELEVPHPQVSALLHPGPGVVQEQEQGTVSEGESPCSREPTEQRLDLVSLEEMRLCRCRPLHGDGRHLLTEPEHLGLAAGDVVEQRVQRRQALVARADLVASSILEMPEESEDSLAAQVLDGEPGDLRFLVTGHEAQQEPDGVTVAAHRGWTEPLCCNEVVEKEGLHDRSEGSRPAAHRSSSDHAGWAKASKRRLASASSWGVMVR